MCMGQNMVLDPLELELWAALHESSAANVPAPVLTVLLHNLAFLYPPNRYIYI